MDDELTRYERYYQHWGDLHTDLRESETERDWNEG